MIHRAPFGSLERFIAVLIEHCGGNFPLWLAPDQVAVLPISEKYNDYAKNVLTLLNNFDIRGFVDDRNEKIGKKIRDNEINKIPFMLVVGEKEEAEQKVAVRARGKGDIGSFTAKDFAAYINELIESDFKRKASAEV
jgi:threonyl-tRNA synthetase